MAIDTFPVSRKTIRAAALPAEHGGWGFLLEPILLGLFAAASWAGLLLSLCAVSVFLIHQPLKMTLKDYQKGLRLPRTLWAERFLMGYGVLAVCTLLATLATAPHLQFLLPLMVATPFALIQMGYDLRNDSRAFLPEVCGSVALGSVASAIALLAGWQLTDSLLLWGLLALRNVPSIAYIRTRIQLEKGRDVPHAEKAFTWNLNLLAFGIVTVISLLEVVPIVSLFPFVVLFLRAIFGISHYRKPTRTAILGVRELAYGFLLVLFVAGGYGLTT